MKLSMCRPSTTMMVGALVATALLLTGAPLLAAGSEIPKTAAGKPDFSGFYDTKTLTPLMRPAAYGDNLYLTPEEADKIAERVQYWNDRGSKASDPNRGAPPVGGDGGVDVPPEYRGAAGGVGGYNTFYVDRGTDAMMIDGKYRTSIIYEPKNGRMPALTAAAMKKAGEGRKFRRENTGTAWWLELDGAGPYDDPESRPLGDRCLLGFGSTGGPPSLPVMYNNLKRLVQTDDHLMIMVEMNHDARVIPIDQDATHGPEDVRQWLGDSVAYWDDDTLVVKSKNFRDTPSLFLATENLEVTERFSYSETGTLVYNFTVNDPTVWTEPWSGEYPWVATDDKVYEYGCHEGNYAMPGILKGARLLEREAMEKAADASSSDDDR